MMEWISVTDRLPEERKTVLVTDGLFVHHGYLIDNRWWSYASAPEGFATTHWMPLPQPPKVEVEG
jgi:hypothetical protein